MLGSATPSLESWQRARQGRYTLVEMPRRVLGRPLPAVGTIDLRTERRSGPHAAISRTLHRAMTVALEAGGQVILLLNRRGYATHIQCPGCGRVVRCPDCDIALTHHRSGEVAVCHYCDYRVPAPTRCQGCGFSDIRYGGLGTQRLEAEVRARFPHAACLRMDTDAMRARGAHERALAQFRSGKARILLGTQMIAKGLDFPNVTLVGVVQADTALHLPDFRAAERTFQLLTQVAGRTGRGERGGRVLIQTFDPGPSGDCRGGAARFRGLRGPRAAAPRIAALSAVWGHDPGRGSLAPRGGGRRIRPAGWPSGSARPWSVCGAVARVLGPAPAPFPRLRGKYRFHVQVQGPDGDQLRAALRSAQQEVQPPAEVQWMIDVDPLDML